MDQRGPSPGPFSRFMASMVLFLALALGAPCFAQIAVGQRMDLGNGLVATVLKCRTWASYDGRAPDRLSEFWRTAGGAGIEPAPGSEPAPLLIEGSMRATLPTGGYSAKALPLSSERYPVGLKAEGRFIDLWLEIKNEGKGKASLELIGSGGSAVDAELRFKKTAYPAKAFSIPGVAVSPASMIVGWSGGLGVDLEPGNSTWIKLLFDLPASVGKADFRLASAKASTFELPK